MENRVKEIINKPDSEVLDQVDMEYVVEQYIKERKGKSVKVLLPGPNHPLAQAMPKEVFAQMVFAPEFEKLAHAFNHAKAYFKNKNN